MLLSALIVLGYIFLGGLTSAIYNEVLQFFLIVAGFRAAGVDRAEERGRLAGHQADAAGDHDALLARHGARLHQHAGRGVDRPGDGPGLRALFGYWCTDFLVIQRAMAANSEVSARRVPLIAAVPKMLFPFLVILPGLIAITVTSHMPGAGAAAVVQSTGHALPGTLGAPTAQSCPRRSAAR